MEKLELRKLHCIVPASMFPELRKWDMLKDIDSIVVKLLCEEIERRKDNGEEMNGREKRKKFVG